MASSAVEASSMSEPITSMSSATMPSPPILLQPVEVTDNVTMPPRTKLRLALVLTALYLAMFITALDQTIVATSTPTISAQLHSASGYFWIGGAYLLANAAAGPIWAKFSDIWGRKPSLLANVALFAAASILAALSTSMRMLIVARALQGTAGGGLFQLVIITISDLFSVRQRTLFVGLCELVWALAAGVGPLIGGAFTTLASWRWCFWINLPVCVTAFVLLFCCLDVHNPKTRFWDGVVAIDWFGTLAILGLVLMLLLGLDFGGSIFPWKSSTVICLLVFGTFTIGLFVLCEKRVARYPLMPLGIFSDRSTCCAFITCFTHGMVFMGMSFYLPLYFQAVKQTTPLRSGVLILPYCVPEGILGICAAFIMHRTGRYREVIWAGSAILALGSGLFILLTPSTSIAAIAAFSIIAGLGSGVLFEAPLIAVQAMVSQADTATATATFGFIRTVASAMSIVLGGVVFQNGVDQSIASLQDGGVSAAVIDALSGGKAAANIDIVKTIDNVVQRELVEHAFAWSLRNMWIMYTCIAGVGLVASFFVAHKHLNEEHMETRTGLMEQKDRGP